MEKAEAQTEGDSTARRDIQQSLLVDTSQNGRDLIEEPQGGKEEVQKVSMASLNNNASRVGVDKAKSRASYDDLDELHFDILEQLELEEERNPIKGGGCCWSVFSKNVAKPAPKGDEWLKHFRLVVENRRFIKNAWYGGLFAAISSRFEKYQFAQSDQQELHNNAHFSLKSIQRQSSAKTLLSPTEPTDDESDQDTRRCSVEHKSEEPAASLQASIKQIIENSLILDEFVEEIREEACLDAFESAYQKTKFPAGQPQTRWESAQAENDEKCSKERHRALSDISHQQISGMSEWNGKERVNREVKDTGNHNSSIQTQSGRKLSSRTRTEMREKFALSIDIVARSKKRQTKVGDRQRRESPVMRQLNMKTNTLLIDSEKLQKVDSELYEAAVFYKSITSQIEAHLEGSYSLGPKPLKVIRDNFISFYERQYGTNLQALTEEQIIESITDLKEFVTLYLEIVREYFKLDELADTCPLAERFMTTDNLVNFLSAILFADDTIYSIVYVSHCHFETEMSQKYFQSIKNLAPVITLALLKVEEAYMLDHNTLKKLLPSKDVAENQEKLEIARKQFQLAQPFSKAIENFKTIAGCRSPVHKLKVMIKTQDLINESIKEFYSFFGIDHAEIFYDADNLLGIFSFVLIKSEVYDIIAHCKVIENFATKSTLNSHSGYLLVTLQCCIRFLTTWDTDTLKAPKH